MEGISILDKELQSQVDIYFCDKQATVYHPISKHQKIKTTNKPQRPSLENYSNKSQMPNGTTDIYHSDYFYKIIMYNVLLYNVTAPVVDPW